MILPQGWATCRFDDTVEIVRGVTFSKSERAEKPGSGMVPCLRSGNVQRELTTEKLIYVPATVMKSDSRYIRSGDTIVSMSNSYELVGKVARAGARHVGMTFGAFLSSFRSDSLDDGFLYNLLRSPPLQAAMRATASQTVNISNLSIAGLANVALPVPPMAEQRRIVAKLDALTARLTRARAELDRVPLLAETMRLSALRTSFHWDEDPASLPSGWARKRIDEVGSVQLGRQRSPKDHTGPHMRLYMRSANITWSGWDLSDVKEMNFSPAEFETFNLQPGDVLLNEGSGSAKEVGKPAIWNGEIEGACFQNTLLRIRPAGYLPELLRYCLLYVALSGQFIRNTQGVNIIHIGKAGLAKTIIPVPPQDQQVRLLETLDVAFARADRLEAKATRARALLDRLESAILAKAFRGELAAQDPTDEPAQTLLDRIRHQRAAAPKAKRGRPKRA